VNADQEVFTMLESLTIAVEQAAELEQPITAIAIYWTAYWRKVSAYILSTDFADLNRPGTTRHSTA
jgi:hypothetical protein